MSLLSLLLLKRRVPKTNPPPLSCLLLSSLSYHPSPSLLTLPEPELEETGPKPEEEKSKPRRKGRAALAVSRLVNSEPWSKQLEARLSAVLPTLSSTSFDQALTLIRSPSKSLLFFNWAHHHGHPHRPSSLLLIIRILTCSRQHLHAARDLLLSVPASLLSDRPFNCLCLAYARAGSLRLSLLAFRLMPRLSVPRSVFSFNTMLSILLRRGRTHSALNLYQEMRHADGVSPDVCTFNILIRGFCLNSMVDVAFRFFREMARFRCCPDVVTYNSLVDGLCRAGKVRIAHNLLMGMWRRRKGNGLDSDLSPNVVTYTTVIRGYCEKRLVRNALELFDEMLRRGVAPNSITYNTLVQGLCEARELDKIKDILEGVMGSGEFSPDTCTFNTLMTAHCNAGNLDEALKMFEKMPQLKVEPDSATYSLLIRCLCQRGDYDKAEELFNELAGKEILLQSQGCVPLVAAYNPMFEYLCEQGKAKKADRVFRQLFKRGIQDPPAFKTLILGHCKEGTLQQGYEILVLMLRRDFVPDAETYDSLIEGFMRKGEPCFAYKTLEKMLSSGHLPRTSTFHSVLSALVRDGCAREAASLITVMLERRIRQNINLSTDTLIALFKSSLRDSAFEVLRLLYDNGYTMKMEKVVGFLCQKNKLLEARDLLLFSLEKHGHLDIGINSIVITGLCEIRKVSEAFSLFYELTEKGGQLDLSCLTDLQVALEADGRSKEADFVSKRIMRRC